METVVVTGASGFVGRALRERAAGPCATLAMSGDDWRAQLAGIPMEGATVYHLAARVHHAGGGDEAAYIEDNATKTRVLAQAAASGHARRIVFLSTIKVNGEETHGRAFRPGDAPAPEDAYARSKLAAEQALAQVAAASGLEVSIVRSPLVYGPSAGGNLRSLMRLAASPWPLPFATLDNRRSFIHVDDLAALLMACARHPQAPGRTYFAAHPRSVSTCDLVAALRQALGRPRRLFAVPGALLETAAALGGQASRMRRLTRSLEVDASDAERDIGWSARISFEDAIDGMARAYREESAG
jgi:nucleoside-diphosphate-sugar epimerase